jgi:MinD superfamily P-loop ATPase
MIADFAAWMDKAGYPDIDALCGEALKLFNMSPEVADERRDRLSAAYRAAQPDPDLCTGCEQCLDVCWYDALAMQDGLAVKSKACVGCGYCFYVCPAGALEVPAGDILASVFSDR